jgi:gliding motility-associated-like protein
MTRIVFFLLLSQISIFRLKAQCISSFPYTENFNAGNGNWTTGGTVSDWTWGQPTKITISKPAGDKCWITGGLTTTFYNLGEASWVQSPCFDFSGLQYPRVSFLVNWETERTYDGAVFQYSTNGGTTWINVGTSTDPVDCQNNNWFNTSAVNYLSGLANPNQGWAGNTHTTSGSCQGGGGSNGWLPASHCLAMLAGKPNVLFRFAFGAGTQCNNFDGFAFDDITISETPPQVVDFSSSCNGSSISFTGIISACATDFVWDFGDGTTGSGLTAAHTYNGSGPYNVTFTASANCTPSAAITKSIQLISANAGSVPVTCVGASDGKAFVSTSGGSGYTYVWNTSPAQTADTAFNLAAGNYTVTVSATGFCDATASAAVNEPAPITLTFVTTADTCHNSIGTINTTVTGGNAPYQFLWSNSSNINPVTSLSEGPYAVTVSDVSGCSVTGNATVTYASAIRITKNVSCHGAGDVHISVSASGGNAPYTFNWSNNATTATIMHANEGIYYVTVTDAGNCSNSDSIIITKGICPSFIYFPTGFSPNGDGVNDVFRPRYSADLKKYELRVYNRWGEEVFISSDVTDGWDGVFKGLPQPLGTYVWYADYVFSDDKKHSEAGNVTLVR